MIVKVTDPKMFFVRTRSYRSRGTIVAMALCALAAVAFFVLAATLPLNSASVTLKALVTLGIAALACALCSLLDWTRKETRHAVSDRGVTLGDQFWPWKSIKAIRAIRLRASWPVHIVIWTGRRRRGPGRTVWVDEHMTNDQALKLVWELRNHFAANNLEIQCEACCRDPRN